MNIERQREQKMYLEVGTQQHLEVYAALALLWEEGMQSALWPCFPLCPALKSNLGSDL